MCICVNSWTILCKNEAKNPINSLHQHVARGKYLGYAGFTHRLLALCPCNRASRRNLGHMYDRTRETITVCSQK